MSDDLLVADVSQRIGEYLERDVSHLTWESRLATALPGLDSMKLFEMVLYLEECFGVEFEDDVMANLETLDDLVSYIRRRRAGAEPVLAE